MPIIIRYLGREQFGVWSTLITTMSWVVFFDLGVGNGLRNKVAESLAKNERGQAKRYIASGYTFIGLIALAIWFFVSAGSYYISWQFVFNTKAIPEEVLRDSIQIAVFFIALNFWVGLVTSLLGAIQKTSFIALGQLVSNILILCLVFVLSRSAEASITYLAFAYGFSLVFSNVLLSFFFFQTNPDLRPKQTINKEYIRPLLNVGAQFFIIQIAFLVIFTTDKILITHLFGPQYVVEYDSVFKIFSIITFLHGIVLAPLWSSCTDAYCNNDFKWIKKNLYTQLIIFCAIVVVVILLALMTRSIIYIWLGDEIVVSSQLIWAMGFFVVVTAWNSVYATVVNGVGEIKLQLYTAVIAMLMNVPLSIIIVKIFGLGIAGVVLATILSLSIAAIVLPIQVHFKILSKSNNVR
ncbi:MAG: oligosaccharide flippase family protein [Ignavibacteria bacterium]|nr:oligosaccharide flippase family protein [Ignavibacteria bacterium]